MSFYQGLGESWCALVAKTGRHTLSDSDFFGSLLDLAGCLINLTFAAQLIVIGDRVVGFGRWHPFPPAPIFVWSIALTLFGQLQRIRGHNDEHARRQAVDGQKTVSSFCESNNEARQPNQTAAR